MNNLYRRLTDKGYTNTQIDELLWRMSHRLPINYTDLEELIDYLHEYVKWNMQQEATKNNYERTI